MTIYQRLISTAVFYLVLIYLANSSKSKHPGHLQPFGSSGPFDQLEEINESFPDPWTFFNEYLFKSHPVVFRQALANDSHKTLWEDDENLKELFHGDNQKIHVETVKKENRQQKILEMKMIEFLQRYTKEEFYMVEEVPFRLRPFLVVPTSLQCPAAIKTFQVAMMWFSSGNTSSVIHTDDYDNINCVLQGEKDFVLIDPHQNPEVALELIDVDEGSYSSADIDRVDYNKFPSLNSETMRYFRVTMKPGDCLFLPAYWIHQVRSENRNIAVNYWLEHERAINADIDRETCESPNISDFVTLETIPWPSIKNDIGLYRNFLMNLVKDGLVNKGHWLGSLSFELDFDLESDSDMLNIFNKMFEVLDENQNGLIKSNELESAFDSERINEAFALFQDIAALIHTSETSSDVESDSDHDEL